ncbi:MAG: ribonuclease HII [Ignavibacteria bacterium]|nr:MAG: ribonuclease HII [Ignavibacteria bacterium]
MTGLSTMEFDLLAQGYRSVAGVDEAGRGPLAGPVVAAAVIFTPNIRLEGIGDSKALSATRREELSSQIREHAAAWGIGRASPEEIDELNILQASILAMHRAIGALNPASDYLLVDGNRFHHPDLPFTTVVKGDARCFSIGAASILAKVDRDRIMKELHERYPEYDFAKHKGYPTASHIDALRRHGPCPIHRRSFHVRSLDE